METTGTDSLPPEGYNVNFGSSYIQTVTFDERGPVAEAILTYGQAPHPDSPFAFDQLPLYSEKTWLRLPFHPPEIERDRIGQILRLRKEGQ